jgi:hypothetical protein
MWAGFGALSLYSTRQYIGTNTFPFEGASQKRACGPKRQQRLRTMTTAPARE